MSADKESLIYTKIRVNCDDTPDGKSIHPINHGVEVLFDAPEIGIRLERRGEYMHVYLDFPEAKRLAPHFLPDEGLVRCHETESGKALWVYRVVDGRPS